MVLLVVLASLVPGCINSEVDNTKGKEKEKEKQETPAYNFSLYDTEGVQFNLTDHRGRIVLLEFMFIHCGFCENQLRSLKKIHTNYTMVDILTISVKGKDTTEELREYKSDNNITWPVARDVDDELDRAYSISTVPTMYLIDQDGAIAWCMVGVAGEEAIREQIDSLL